MPAFCLEDRGFKGAKLHAEMERTWRPRARRAEASSLLEVPSATSEVELAWHVRAWARRVADRVRSEVAGRYPTYAEFEPVAGLGKRGDEVKQAVKCAHRPPQVLDSTMDVRAAVGRLNEEFDSEYLEDGSNPRWVAKPVVAYLWARTVTCNDCRGEVPLLKTRWLCRKGKKRAWLGTMAQADGTFNVWGTGGAVSATQAQPVGSTEAGVMEGPTRARAR